MNCNCDKRERLSRLVDYYEKMVDLKTTEYDLHGTATVLTQLKRYKDLLAKAKTALNAEKVAENCVHAIKRRRVERENAEKERASQRKFEAYDATVKTVAVLVKNDTKIVEAINALRADVDKMKAHYDPLKK